MSAVKHSFFDIFPLWRKVDEAIYDANMPDSNALASAAVTECSLENLRAVFTNGEAIYAVTDEDGLCADAAELGCRPVLLADLGNLPVGANVVLFLERTLITVELRRALASAAVLVVPISSFDPDINVGLYTQQLTFRTNYTATCARNRDWVESIAGQSGPLVFTAAASEDGNSRTDLTCWLGNDLRGETCLKPQLGVGDWVSVGTYCEVALVATSFGDSKSFDVSGTADIAGVLVGQDGRATTEGSVRALAGRRLRETMVARGPITLSLEDGKLASVQAGDEDFTEPLLEVISPEYDRYLLELGLGTNGDILPWVNWSLNSQLNEGVGPVHLGFGDGVTGAHVDFLVKDCVYRFREAE